MASHQEPTDRFRLRFLPSRIQDRCAADYYQSSDVPHSSIFGLELEILLKTTLLPLFVARHAQSTIFAENPEKGYHRCKDRQPRSPNSRRGFDWKRLHKEISNGSMVGS